MTTDQVKAYVDTQVQNMADSRIKPLIQSVNSELALQRCNNDKKAALDADNAASDARIKVLQTEIGKAQSQVNELATKLAEATTVAVTSGAE
jgi:hypothetical protein